METVFCPYCGCGCTLQRERGKASHGSGGTSGKILANPDDVISEGKPCTKGLTVHEVLETGRLTSPMIRRSKSDDLEKCTWDEAFDFVKENLDVLSQERDGNLRDAVYFVGSGEVTNEANYLLSKLSRSHFGSNNVDSCARLCHSSTAEAFGRMFGIKAIPNVTINDLREGDCFLFIGTDPVEDYPVLFNRVLDARKNGAKIISIDVASNSTTAQSDHFFQITPGGILPLLSHLIVMLVDGSDISRDTRSFERFDEFVDSARQVSQENPPSSFGFTREDIDELYWLMNESKQPVIGFGMGLTQHKNGTQHVYAAAGLSMLLDAVLFPNRGKVNIQGCGDVGCDPVWRPRDDSGWKGKWDFKFAPHEGAVMTEGLYNPEVKFTWIMGGNPSQSMPDLNELDESFRKKFVVLQHHHPVRTMEFADVVLPGMMLSEEYGSVTNGERRVRGLYGDEDEFGRKITIGKDGSDKVEIISNAEILLSFARKLGIQHLQFNALHEVFEEMIEVTPGYEHLTMEQVVSEEGQFAQKEPVFKKFIPFNDSRMHFQGKGEYPFVFTTARNRFHFCTSGATRYSKTLRDLAGNPSVFMNPQDANMMELSDESEVRIISEVGEITALVKQDAGVEKRVIVAPFHFEKLLVNRLTPRELDPESGTPCYKEVAVKVEKV